MTDARIMSGPWHVTEGGSSKPFSIHAPGSKPIIHFTTYYPQFAASHAALMASAPDLLDVLKAREADLAAMLTDKGLPESLVAGFSSIRIAREAIAKATTPYVPWRMRNQSEPL